ncbi:hypothetical protein J6590_025154 [Homalodisca vitripennis]|nr:hypothetical protein J6590_025154 [Homalodisca vitripennis]
MTRRGGSMFSRADPGLPLIISHLHCVVIAVETLQVPLHASPPRPLLRHNHIHTSPHQYIISGSRADHYVRAYYRKSAAVSRPSLEWMLCLFFCEAPHKPFTVIAPELRRLSHFTSLEIHHSLPAHTAGLQFINTDGSCGNGTLSNADVIGERKRLRSSSKIMKYLVIFSRAINSEQSLKARLYAYLENHIIFTIMFQLHSYLVLRNAAESRVIRHHEPQQHLETGLPNGSPLLGSDLSVSLPMGILLAVLKSRQSTEPVTVYLHNRFMLSRTLNRLAHAHSHFFKDLKSRSTAPYVSLSPSQSIVLLLLLETSFYPIL